MYTYVLLCSIHYGLSLPTSLFLSHAVSDWLSGCSSWGVVLPQAWLWGVWVFPGLAWPGFLYPPTSGCTPPRRYICHRRLLAHRPIPFTTVHTSIYRLIGGLIGDRWETTHACEYVYGRVVFMQVYITVYRCTCTPGYCQGIERFTSSLIPTPRNYHGYIHWSIPKRFTF